MTGTFGGALEARGVPASKDQLVSETTGEIERENGVLVIKRIHVVYRLKIDSALLEEKREAIDRVLRVHANACPVHKSIAGCIDITTELELRTI